MELKINLEGIFADEEGNDVNDSIKETIINEVSERIFSAVQTEAKAEEAKEKQCAELGDQLSEKLE